MCGGGGLNGKRFQKKYQADISEHLNSFSFDKKKQITQKKISESVIHKEKKTKNNLSNFFLKQSEK